MGSSQGRIVLNLTCNILRLDLEFIERYWNVSLWLTICRDDISRSLLSMDLIKIKHNRKRYNLAPRSDADVSVLMMWLGWWNVNSCCQRSS